MTDFFIGINGGATRTTFVAVDRDLNVLARLETGPSNAHNIGMDAVHETLKRAASDLIAQGSLHASDMRGVGAGMSGIDRDRPDDLERMRSVISLACWGVPVSADNDGMVALVAGAGERRGVVVISGTGSIVIGADGPVKHARCGGWGYLLDQGSGYWIGRHALVAIAHSHDSKSPATALTGRILARLGLSAPTDLVAWLYAPQRTVPEFAALAAEVVALADSDLTAQEIILRAADSLADDALTVAKRLGFATQSFPLVMSGGLFDHCSLLRDRYIASVQAALHNAVPIHTLREAALGAAMMAILDSGDRPFWAAKEAR